MFKDGVAIFSLVLSVVTICCLLNVRPGSRRAIHTQAPFIYRELSYLDSDMKQRYELQKRIDRINTLYLPRLDEAGEHWPGGYLELGEPSYRGRQSIVYPIRDNPSLFLKYQADCEEIYDKKLHPLLLEFWYGKKASAFGISPDVLFLSPPVAFDSKADKLTRFHMSREKREKCEMGGGTVRFAVLHRLQTCIDLYTFRDRFPGGRVPFPMAIKIGISLIEHLQRLHFEAQIFHGDIHPGNIMIDGADLSDFRVWLIDFGRSRANLPARSKEPVYCPFTWVSSMMSPWQIEGYEWSARDDVFNAIRTLALLINGNEYSEYERRMKLSGPRHVLNWKKYGRIWFPPGLNEDPFKSLHIGPFRRMTIRTSLNRLILSVQSLHDVDAVPDYGEILQEFHRCLDLADITKPVKF
jgi:hypothetical protein